ncbi:MAG: discoidin domain-containing protein [Sedimentisphaerales bacterium]|nr:discoidin domain-containing protein [Sedimentisphaerales bacterium]
MLNRHTRLLLTQAILLFPIAAAAGPSHADQLDRDYILQLEQSARHTSGTAVTTRQDAAGAVDGIKNASYAFHTNLDDAPWWQVDLGDVFPIDRVVVYNRPGCETQTKILDILISLDGQNWRKVFTHNGLFYGAKINKPLIAGLDGLQARLIRLQNPARAFMYLDEVEVFSTQDKNKNVAVGKPADQSSTSQWSTNSLPPQPAEHYPRAARNALDLAVRTLDFVRRVAPGPDFTAEIDRFRAELDAQDTDFKALYLKIRRFRRSLILSHPLLGFERLLINKRPPPSFNHQTDQYLGRHNHPGPGLIVLSDWKTQPRENVILEGKLPRGTVLHPDLSFDAKRILFSFCDQTVENPNYRRFFIYEAAADGAWVRRLTGTKQDPLEGAEGRRTVQIEDYDPCYLPDGGFAFISTRNQGGVRCHYGDRFCPTYVLYRADADGKNIIQLAYGEANEWDPSVLPDGRIIWTRWDYINRHDTLFQSLWTTRPDGTAPAHFFGNYTRNPCVTCEPRAIPNSNKIVCTASAHHHYTAGSIVVVDPYKGIDGPEPITRITPEVAFPETEGWDLKGAYAGPYPLSEDLFFAAYSYSYRGDKPHYAIYLIDSLGGKELICRDEQVSCFTPIPIVPRPAPPVLPRYTPSTEPAEMGTFFVKNVYKSARRIPPGSVKSLRVVRVYPQPTQAVPVRSIVMFETCKEILGKVPVADDGSVAFRAPAQVPLLFQLLDANDMAVMSMRSFTYLHPGESASCTGCHEPRDAVPALTPQPADIPIHDLTPPVGPKYPGGLSFAKTVQPVLDRYCIKCHGLDEKNAGLDFLGTLEFTKEADSITKLIASTAYNTIVNSKGLVSFAPRNLETDYSEPKDYFSHAGKLAEILMRDRENDVKLDGESFLRVIYWLDLNAQYYGEYSFNKDEWRRIDPEGEKALRACIAENFGEKLANQPFAALVNIALPCESRILKAPLALDAGGWGQIEKWAGTNEPGYKKMSELVNAAIAPLQFHDVNGTCNRPECLCNSCWTRQAETEYAKKIRSPAPTNQSKKLAP